MAKRSYMMVLILTTILVCSPITPVIAALKPVDKLRIPEGQDPTQCHSYGSSVNPGREEAKVIAGLNTLWVYKAAKSQPYEEAKALFDRYLTPGIISPVRTQVQLGHAAELEFESNKRTIDAYTGVRSALTKSLAAYRPVLEPPDTPLAFQLKQIPDAATNGTLGLGQKLQINYTPPAEGSLADKISTPALIAGSTGSLISQINDYTDRRDISGKVTLVPTANSRGVITDVQARIESVKLQIEDSIDFCPGGLGSASGPINARTITLPMSRLERTPAPGGGGYTTPILWSTDVQLQSKRTNVTSAFNNDQDGDQVPNWEPWEGAGYALDNCPDVANPGQADSNGNGIGDACDNGSAKGIAGYSINILNNGLFLYSVTGSVTIPDVNCFPETDSTTEAFLAMGGTPTDEGSYRVGIGIDCHSGLPVNYGFYSYVGSDGQTHVSRTQTDLTPGTLVQLYLHSDPTNGVNIGSATYTNSEGQIASAAFGSTVQDYGVIADSKSAICGVTLSPLIAKSTIGGSHGWQFGRQGEAQACAVSTLVRSNFALTAPYISLPTGFSRDTEGNLASAQTAIYDEANAVSVGVTDTGAESFTVQGEN